MTEPEIGAPASPARSLWRRRLQIVHYDKTRASEGSRVRSQMTASAEYADSFLVLSAMRDEPWEPFWTQEKMVRHFLSAPGTLGRFRQELAAGWWLAEEARKGRFDVLHAHHNTALIVALVWVLFAGKPAIFDSHDLFAPSQTNRRSPVRRFCSWLKWGMLQKFVLARCLCGVHVSPGIIRIYRGLFPETSHELLWNLPAFALHSAPAGPEEGEVVKEEKVGPLRLVYFGLLTSERISLPLIKTVAAIPGVTLALYGRLYDQADDYEEYSRQFNELLKDVPVKWHGSYRTADLPEILEQTDMLMHPIPVISDNNRHALPNKLFEACYNGKAVLYSSVFQDMHGLAQEYGFGCSFDPNNLEAARQVIEGLVAEPSRVQTMKNKASTFVFQSPWSADAYRLRLKEIYSRAASALNTKFGGDPVQI